MANKLRNDTTHPANCNRHSNIYSYCESGFGNASKYSAPHKFPNDRIRSRQTGNDKPPDPGCGGGRYA